MHSMAYRSWWLILSVHSDFLQNSRQLHLLVPGRSIEGFWLVPLARCCRQSCMRLKANCYLSELFVKTTAADLARLGRVWRASFKCRWQWTVCSTYSTAWGAHLPLTFNKEFASWTVSCHRFVCGHVWLESWTGWCMTTSWPSSLLSLAGTAWAGGNGVVRSCEWLARTCFHPFVPVQPLRHFPNWFGSPCRLWGAAMWGFNPLTFENLSSTCHVHAL